MALGDNRDPIYAPDGRTWYETAIAEAEKRGKFHEALRQIEALDTDTVPTSRNLAVARDLARSALND